MSYWELWLSSAVFSGWAFLLFVLPGVVLGFVLTKIFFGRLQQKETTALLLFWGLAWTLAVHFWALNQVYLESSLWYVGSVLAAGFVFYFCFYHRVLRWLVGLFPVIFLLLFVLTRFDSPSVTVKSAEDSQGQQQPNILLVVVDTLRRDHLPFYGYERNTMPFVQSLISKGVLFNDVVSTSSWTKPSMASLLTGKELLDDAIHLRARPLEYAGTTLPQVFSEQGFNTALFTANPNAGSQYRSARGYQHYFQPYPAAHFPLHQFLWPRFFKYQAELPKLVQYENSKRRLDWYVAYLNLKDIQDLKAALRDKAQPFLNAQLVHLLENHEHLKKYKENIPSWKRNYFAPLAQKIYSQALEFGFVKAYGASGDYVVDHWMSDAEVADAFIDWNKEQNGKPFFAHIQMMAPHDPYYPQPPRLLNPYFDSSGPYVEEPPFEHYFPSQKKDIWQGAQQHNLMAAYDNAIRASDAQIEKIVQHLQETGQWQNTVLVFMSDHGESFGAHNTYDHMYSLHNEHIQVPLFVMGPGVPVGELSKLPVSLIDVFPSLLGLLKWQLQGVELDGLDLTQALTQDYSQRVRRSSVHVFIQDDPVWGWDVDFAKAKGEDALSGVHRSVIQNGHKLLAEWEYPETQKDKVTETFFVFDFPDNQESRDQDQSLNDIPANLMQHLLFPHREWFRVKQKDEP